MNEASLKKLMSEVFRISPEEIFEGAEYQSLPEWDSLAHIELMRALELESSKSIDSE